MKRHPMHRPDVGRGHGSLFSVLQRLALVACGLLAVQSLEASHLPSAARPIRYAAGLLDQAITNFLPSNGSAFAGTNMVGLSAQASSSRTVSFAVGSGPGLIAGGTHLVFTATGLVRIVASQAGNSYYDAAPNVTNTYTVLPASIQDQAIANFLPANGSAYAGTNQVGLSAQVTSLLPVHFAVGSGPGLITGSTNLVFTATGLVSIVASQTGTTFYAAASNVTHTYSVLPVPIQGQTITNFLPSNGAVLAGTNKVGLSAQATSLLPVRFAVGSGPGVITGDTNLAFTATGLVSIVASQTGSLFYTAAQNVINTFTVTPPLASEPGWLAVQVTPTSGSWRVTAPPGYTGPTVGTGDLAAASAVVGEYTIVYGPLSGYLAPTNQALFVIAGETSLVAGVYRPVEASLVPPVLTATEGTYTNKVQLACSRVTGATGYEIWKSATNDVATAGHIADISDDGATAFQYDDTAVVPGRSYYYWGLTKTATQVSPMGLVSLGYAALAPEANAATADLAASDLVYLPVHATNLTAAGTVSFWVENMGPDTLSSATVAFDFRMGRDASAMTLLGSVQRAITLTAGKEQLVILTAQEKRGVIVPATLSGDKQVQVTLRHASTLNDPTRTNNTTTAAGTVRVRALGVNSPERSVNDYDGDGKSDLALISSDKSIWSTLLSGTRNTELAGMSADTSAGTFWTAVGDYDGDHLLDYGLYEETSGTWYIMNSSNGLIVSGVFGGAGFRPVPGDYDGDGKTDPALYASASGYWVVLKSGSNYATREVWAAGTAGYEPVPSADYDGDGRADLMAYLAANGHWMGLLSGQNYAPVEWSFGGPGYQAGAADFDGDGLADPALYKQTDGTWWVLLSAATYQAAGFVLGGAGTAAIMGDYDGDGRTDPAVYSEDGTWYGWLSGHNYESFNTRFGGANEQPISELINE